MKIDSSVGLFDILSLKVISTFELKSIWVELGWGETESTSGGVVSTGPPGGIPSFAQYEENRIRKSEVKPIGFLNFIESEFLPDTRSLLSH